MTNEEVIEEAVVAFRLGFAQAALEGEQEQLARKIPVPDPAWPQPGVRLIFADPEGYEVVVRPEGDDGADIDVLGPNGVSRAHAVEEDYASPDELRRRIEILWHKGLPVS